MNNRMYVGSMKKITYTPLVMSLLHISFGLAVPPQSVEFTVNSGFGSSLVGWNSLGAASWSSQDINASPSSGSALLDVPTQYTQSIDQCVTNGFFVGDRLTATAWFSGASGHTTPGLAIVYYPNSSCLYTAMKSEFVNFDGSLSAGGTGRLSIYGMAVPSGTFGILVSARASTSQPAQVYVDNVHLMRTEQVFADDFESRL